jgi:threonine aldolase
MPARLPEDHANARYLAEEGAKIPGIAIDPSSVATNIVIYDVAGTGKSTAEISAALKDRGVLMNGIGGSRLRAVTHYDVSRAQCETAIAALREVCAL